MSTTVVTMTQQRFALMRLAEVLQERIDLDLRALREMEESLARHREELEAQREATVVALNALNSVVVGTVEREGVSSYELAMNFKMMAHAGMNGAAIAEAFRSATDPGRSAYTKDYVNNLLRCLRNLNRKIVLAWEARDPRAKVSFLIRLASLPDRAQMRAWRAEP